MGLLDPNLFTNPALLNQLKGLLGNMPIAKLMRGEESVTQEGLLGAMRAMPVFQNDAGQSAYDAAMNIGPMGLGKIVYHGSPHKFDKFDASKIGTGEGAQAYGHGIYMADSPGVAKTYAEQVKDMAKIDAANKEMSRLAKVMEADQIPGQWRKYRTDAGRLAAEQYDALMASKMEPGALYKADLPDEWIPKMLDWDKPLKDQPENVRAALNGLAKHDKVWARHLADNDSMTGEQIYKALANVEAGGAGRWDMPGNSSAATEYIRSIGIPGIRYLDGGSRGAGQGSYNYVVFPGLEDKVKILERNGVPLQGLLGGS